MQVYSQEEFFKKQAELIMENLMKIVEDYPCKNKTQVIKNYVYMADPVKIY